MSFPGTTTVFTTEGIKIIRELVNVPFTAIINDNLFQCHFGARQDKKRDIYSLITNFGYSTLTTFDQKFLSKDGTFKPAQEFQLKEEMALSASYNHPFESRRHTEATLEIRPEYEFCSSGVYQKFFQLLWSEYAVLSKNSITFRIPNLNTEQFHQIQRMLLRMGVFSSPAYSNGRFFSGILISMNQLSNYAISIGFQTQAQEEDAFMLIDSFNEPEHLYSKFKSLNYHSTQMTYTVEVEGAQAFDSYCFYAAELTIILKNVLFNIKYYLYEK